jgi:glycosyltransferase involved in cell wall biosynthesis
MITSEFPPRSGGVGYYVYHLSKKLHERGHEITVITRGFAGKTARETVNGIEVFRVSFFPIYPFHVCIHSIFVNELLKSLEPKSTLVHLHTPLPPPITTSLPVMTTVHTPMKIDSRYHEILDIYSLAERVQSMFVYPVIESKLLSLSNMITAVSFSVANELKEYGLDPKQVTVVGNGVDEETFIPIPQRKCAEKYVLYTGVLRARKGLFDFIECARRVCEVYSDVKFVICGTGPFHLRLEERVRRMGLQRRVIFLGYVSRDKLVKTYQNATVHVTPSHYEGLPTVLLEAMACGLPVVTTDVGGSGEVISSGVNGFLVPPKCPQAMAEIVLKLLGDDALRKKTGEAARETIEKCYGWDRITDKVLKCYESLL